MRKCTFTLALAVALPLFLASCAGPQPAPPVSKTLQFTEQTPVRLDVATIVVSNEYQPSGTTPEVGESFPVSPVTAIEQWANQRLTAVGQDGSARVIIREASIKAIDLPRTSGIRGVFTTDQVMKYEGLMRVEVIADSAPRRMSGVADATIRRTVSVPENTSPAQREKLQYDMVQNMATDLDRELTQAVQTYLAPFVR